MDTGVIIAIVVGGLVLIALLVMLGRRGRERKLDSRRSEAAEHRLEAEVRGAKANRQAATAEERAARAKREQAIAQEQAARARQDRDAALERQEYADRIDPDVDESESEAGDRETTGRRN